MKSDAWKYFKIVNHLDSNRHVKCRVKHKDKALCKYVVNIMNQQLIYVPFKENKIIPKICKKFLKFFKFL